MALSSSQRRWARTSGLASTIELGGGVGADDGADVPAVHHRAGAAARRVGEEIAAGNRAARRAPPGWRRPGRRPCRPCRCGWRGSPARLKIDGLRRPRSASASFVGIALGLQHAQAPSGDRARRNPDARSRNAAASCLASVPLPRGGGAVDGDDDRSWHVLMALPIIRAQAAHQILDIPGKLVAIMVTSSTVTGFSTASPIVKKAHGDAVIHVGGDRAAAGHAPPRLRPVRSSPSISIVTPLACKTARHRGQPVAFLDAQFLQPAHHRACRRRRRRPRPGSDIRRSSRARASAGTSTPFSSRMAHDQIADLLAAAVAAVGDFDVRAHLQQGLDQPGAARIEQDGGQCDLRARHDQRRHQRESGARTDRAALPRLQPSVRRRPRCVIASPLPRAASTVIFAPNAASIFSV